MTEEERLHCGASWTKKMMLFDDCAIGLLNFDTYQKICNKETVDVYYLFQNNNLIPINKETNKSEIKKTNQVLIGWYLIKGYVYKDGMKGFRFDFYDGEKFIKFHYTFLWTIEEIKNIIIKYSRYAKIKMMLR